MRFLLTLLLPLVHCDSLNRAKGCAGTLCGSSSSEPLSSDIKLLRDSTSCTLANSLVESITPGSPSNPSNVKNVETIFPESKFNSFFPRKDSAYTYTNFLKAIGKYPAICKNASNCPKILANMFAHFQQETAGLYYIEEINKGAYCADWSAWIQKAYPCIPGKKYFGRGAKQLSWNYNYGAFSKAMYGDANVLLEKPELVANTWLNFAATMWFFVTPQPPKPSMLQVVEGVWKPNGVDSAARLKPGFGATTMIINGAQECGRSPPNANGAKNRAKYYREYAAKLGVDITGEKLGCRDSQAFSSGGSAGSLALYWAPESGCSLVKWQTAYSALVEGDYSACKGVTPTSCGTPVSPVNPPAPNPGPVVPPTRRPIAPPTAAPLAPAGSGSCDSLINGKNGWSGAFGGTLSLPLPRDISSYTVVLQTSRPLSKFTTWSSDVSPNSGSSITVKSKPWFGGLKAGNTLSLPFQVAYTGTSEPSFSSISINGVKIC